MTTSTNLGLPYVQAAQAQKHVTHNAALELLDAIVQLQVQGFALDTPPLTPDEGQVWAVGPAPVDDWAGHAGALAAYANGGWLFITPRPGWRAAQGTELRLFDGTGWVAPDLPDLQNLPGVGVNTSYDSTNRLAVASEAVLFTNTGDDVQMKVNKNAAGDTASLLFQTGWSGRAEMGTLGDDDFGVKVSPDGSSWTTAFSVDATTGATTMGQLFLTTALSPAQGGTGIANNAAATLTRSGNHPLTLTTSAATALTLPVSGILATLAGAETLSNKSLTAPTLDGATLAALAASKVETAVDVLVYDTSRDSDGGAWRNRCQSKSWYTETLNTATRGSRRAFPAVAVIVATASAVTIYDGDDPALPMWRVQTPGQTLTRLAALNGRIALGTTTGVVVLNYAADAISGALTYTTATSPAIVNNSVLDIGLAVLAGAPTAPATGLPVPTIAVATSGGLSVLKADGTVANSSTTATVWKVAFAGENLAWSPNSTPENWEITENIGSVTSGFTPTEYLRREDTATGYYPRGPQAATGNTRHVHMGGNRFALSNTTAPSTGVFVYRRGERVNNVKNKGLMAKITTTYNTGWMPGDIKGAWLASKDTASLVGGTDTDRTHNVSDLTVNGTITRTAVASGADLVGYGGFSAANYLSQAYRAALDFSTTGFAVLGWIKEAASAAAEVILERDSAATGQRWTLSLTAAGYLQFTVDDNTTTRTATGATAIDTGVWRHVVALYDGAGGIYIYLDGVLHASATGAALLTLNNASAVLRLGLDVAGTAPLSNGTLALWRITATVPTADQVAKIYADEAVLFQANAACTLYGASDAVTALAHDPATGLLHVGTSAGRSVFSGLRRIANTTTPVTTALAAVGDLIAEQ